MGSLSLESEIKHATCGSGELRQPALPGLGIKGTQERLENGYTLDTCLSLSHLPNNLPLTLENSSSSFLRHSTTTMILPPPTILLLPFLALLPTLATAGATKYDIGLGDDGNYDYAWIYGARVTSACRNDASHAQPLVPLTPWLPGTTAIQCNQQFNLRPVVADPNQSYEGLQVRGCGSSQVWIAQPDGKWLMGCYPEVLDRQVEGSCVAGTTMHQRYHCWR